MTVINAPFRSKFGFESPGFLVDSVGNLTVRSISQTSGDNNVETPADYVITEISNGNEFSFSGLAGPNPTLIIYRDRTYSFDIELDTQTFSLFRTNGTQYYNGLVHSDGSSAADALDKSSGRLRWTVALDTPDSLYYGNATRSIQGNIEVRDPIGTFSTILVKDDTESSNATTGALLVSGGVGIAKNLNVGGTLTTADLQLNGVGIAEISSGTNLSFNADNKIVLKVSDVLVGYIDSSGLSISLNNSSINDSVIGDVTPSTATFISASITETPVSGNNVTNKSYVDNTVTTLAVAFGL